MAKKGNRIIFGLECQICKARNYLSEKNTITNKDKLSFNKFCSNCRKKTQHQEAKLK